MPASKITAAIMVKSPVNSIVTTRFLCFILNVSLNWWNLDETISCLHKSQQTQAQYPQQLPVQFGYQTTADLHTATDQQPEHLKRQK
ncbi:hypothetical protein [Lacticaseibacillus rhamnosus]|uniref:hypothetical protein n=1 Tax=Lacticaseibacillus rhamnosus TaxID=47715 RepID=UPI0017834DD2